MLFVTMVLGANEVVPVLMENRVRYLLALWPPASLLAGLGIWQLGRLWQRPTDWLLAGLVAIGIFQILYTQSYFFLDNHEEFT